MTVSSSSVTPGRRIAQTNKAKIDEYTQEVERAEVHLGNIVGGVLADYLRLVQTAANKYDKAVELSDKIWNDIENPARHNYERQVQLADRSRRAIMEPAQRALKAATDAAQDMYESLAVPAEQAYQDVLNNAQSILSSLTITG